MPDLHLLAAHIGRRKTLLAAQASIPHALRAAHAGLVLAPAAHERAAGRRAARRIRARAVDAFLEGGRVFEGFGVVGTQEFGAEDVSVAGGRERFVGPAGGEGGFGGQGEGEEVPEAGVADWVAFD